MGYWQHEAMLYTQCGQTIKALTKSFNKLTDSTQLETLRGKEMVYRIYIHNNEQVHKIFCNFQLE